MSDGWEILQEAGLAPKDPLTPEEEFFENHPEEALPEDLARRLKLLPARQRKVISMLMEGHTREEVASSLGISRWTVARDLDSIKEKLYGKES